MADLRKKLDANAPGDFFVDATCIDCGACRWMCPDVFDAHGDYARVHAQPSPDRIGRALTAAVACPVASIGVGTHDLKAASLHLPEPLEGADPAHGVHYVGFHSKKSFGAASWLIRRPGGNILVDSPRFTPTLARRLEELGGVSILFLTHRDDVADHEKFRERFGLTRILHQSDLSAATRGVEMQLTGTDPVPLGDDVQLIPVPGHTAGSVCLLYREKYLFTGDHLAFHGSGEQLIAFSRHCWYDWPTQIRSMEALSKYPFEWVLPGHGAPGRRASGEMERSMAELIAWMRRQ